MRPLEIFRQKTFWFVDALKGHPVKKHLDDIDRIMSNWGTPDVESLMDNYLKATLDYAVENIPFYQKLQGYVSLNDFPVVNKSMIRENENAFFDARFNRNELFRQATSGSTGVPFVLYQDSLKRLRATADTLYFSKKADYELGSRLYFSRVWEKGTVRSAWTCFKQNWIMHDASNLSDSDLKKLINSWENDKSTKNVILFASTLSAIARYVRKNNMLPNCRIQSFITISESLDNWTKSVIEDTFRTKVFSRYSNQELGIMAQQLPDCSEFFVNVASFKYELLKMDEDIPAEKGEQGRIVVTDLFGRAMPLIRYDTGDVAIAKKGQNENEVPIFEVIGGRRVDYIYNTKGELVSPYVINTPMHEFIDVIQYQFIQEGKASYTMLLNVNGNTFSQEYQMLNMLKSFLGNDADICVKYVNEIPVLKSGKRKQVVNNYKPV